MVHIRGTVVSLQSLHSSQTKFCSNLVLLFVIHQYFEEIQCISTLPGAKLEIVVPENTPRRNGFRTLFDGTFIHLESSTIEKKLQFINGCF